MYGKCGKAICPISETAPCVCKWIECIYTAQKTSKGEHVSQMTVVYLSNMGSVHPIWGANQKCTLLQAFSFKN